MDFYFAEHPQALLGNEVESCTFNSEYPTVLGRHLYCAAVECGLKVETVCERFGQSSNALLQVRK